MAIGIAERSYNIFCLSRDFTRYRDQKIMWLYGYDPLNISHRPDKFGGYRQCVSGDIKFLTCHMILQDHVTQEP